jgi:hypothetical protein
MSAGTPLLRAWLTLIALSAISAGLTTGVVADFPIAPGLVVLALAFGKAYVILSAYLGLDRSAAWRRGFAIVVALFLVCVAGLYIAAGR